MPQAPAVPVLPSLAGKTIVVTGATSGIGLEASVVLAARGARVVLVGRDAGRAAAARQEVAQRSGSAEVETALGDFGSQASVRALAADLLARCPRLDVLVNNAGGVFKTRTETVDGLEATFAVNHLGPYLLTRLLQDRLVASAPSRVVNVSSIGHYQGTLDLADLGFARGGYGIMKAYQRSKLGNVFFTRALARRLAGQGVTVNALHPGGVATNIWSGAPAWARPILAVLKKVAMITPEEGGRTLTYLAASPEVEGKTGLYFQLNREKHPSRLAQDDALGERLWVESARLVTLPV
jgi:NAD(P)-dependent dehydrogenase (short-subunit alcohol dehydrogenase family)